MDWQAVVSFAIVAAAFVLIVRSEARKYRLRKTHPCGGDCHCSALKISIQKGTKN